MPPETRPDTDTAARRHMTAWHRLRAFTLLELIVVIVVLGVLALLAIPTFAAVVDAAKVRSALSTHEALAREVSALFAFGDYDEDSEEDAFAVWDLAAADLVLGATRGLAASGQLTRAGVGPDDPSPGVAVASVAVDSANLGWSARTSLDGVGVACRVALDATARDCWVVDSPTHVLLTGTTALAGPGHVGPPVTTTTTTTTTTPPPAPPTGVTATRGDAQLTVSFSPVTAATSYTATCTPTSPGVSRSATGAAPPLVVTGLLNGREYSCTVTATSASGTSEASEASEPATPATVPSAPTIASYDAANGAVSAAVSVASDGGAPVTSFRLDCVSATGGAPASGTSGTSPVSAEGLTVGASYTCTATATNAVGDSAPSAPTSAFLMTETPLVSRGVDESTTWGTGLLAVTGTGQLSPTITSSVPGTGIGNVADRKTTSDFWTRDVAGPGELFITFDLGARRVQLAAAKVRSSSDLGGTADVRVYGSEDGSTWSLLGSASVSRNIDTTAVLHSSDTDTKWRYLRIGRTVPTGDKPLERISEVEFYGSTF